jgi:hypothetical protein
MSSRRLFLSGLLSSGARLRVAGYIMLPHYFNRSKSLASLWYKHPATGAINANPGQDFRTLETPDRCLKDRVHFVALARRVP